MLRQNNVGIFVKCDLPGTNVSVEELAKFVEDALSCMGGCRHPNDPLFNSINVKSVRIGRQTFDFEEQKS